MPRVPFRSRIGCIIFGLGLFLGVAQMLVGAGEPPPAPSSMVQDDGRILGSATLEKVSRALLDARRETGVQVYVVTTAFLDASDSQKQIQQILDRWLQDQEGVVINCNRSNGHFGVAGSAEFWRHQPADEIARILWDTGQILRQPGSSQEIRIQDAVLGLVSHLRRLATVPAAQESGNFFTGEEQRLALMIAVVLALTGTLIWLISIVRRKRSGAADGPYLFPEATANPRLGAPFGATLGEAAARREN